MRTSALVLSSQVLSELYVTVTRKLAYPLEPDSALRALADLAVYPVVAIDAALVQRRGARRRRAGRVLGRADPRGRRGGRRRRRPPRRPRGSARPSTRPARRRRAPRRAAPARRRWRPRGRRPDLRGREAPSPAPADTQACA